MAKERADIEERHDPANELERRHRALREDGGEGSSRQHDDQFQPPDNQSACDQSDARLSTVSSSTAFSEATKKELDEINRLLEDAQKRVNSSQADDEAMNKEIKSVAAATRQKSLEIEKVSEEIGRFWDRQLDKKMITPSMVFIALLRMMD
ncbi:hypothetical protein OESDEN_16998 [Oesophagostomum dentatum]|uniref:Uncharacterized protein n=1 Tax=Oesophagostomum dentatum TaxID=61180 RepID=A0A0B1SJB2_OESDE|nr:hypothetical protein OESDEN_16998 [Oesophagostomum dentatum]